VGWYVVFQWMGRRNVGKGLGDLEGGMRKVGAECVGVLERACASRGSQRLF